MNIITATEFFIFERLYLIFDREGGKEKEMERNINVWEEHWSIASRMDPNGTKSTTQACARTGNWTGDLSLCRIVLHQLSHASQGCYRILKLFYSLYIYYLVLFWLIFLALSFYVILIKNLKANTRIIQIASGTLVILA